MTCHTLEEFYPIDGHTFEKQYKEVLSDFRQWDRLEHADEWLLFPDNIGSRLAGLKEAYIKQFHTFSEPNRDPRERVVTIAYYALVRMQEVKGGDDAAKAEWFALDEVPSLAFDHDLILRVALKELRKQIHFEPIGFEVLPEKFTIKELQLLYEAILDVKFDRRNFYNKMKHLEILTQLDETVFNSPKKEAYLFKFNPDKYEELKQKGFRLEF